MDSAHNEHIEPQNWKNGRKSTRSLDYDNIVASCNGFHGEGTYKTLLAMSLDKEIIKQMYLDDQEEYWAFVNVIRWYVNHDRV